MTRFFLAFLFVWCILWLAGHLALDPDSGADVPAADLSGLFGKWLGRALIAGMVGSTAAAFWLWGM